jgi:hypothetical protein
LYYKGAEEAKTIVFHFKKVLEMNPLMNQLYLNDMEHIENEFSKCNTVIN